MRALLWVERLLLIAGAGALIWCAAFVGDALIAQRVARSSLHAAAAAVRPVSAPAAAPSPDRRTGDLPARGTAIGSLSIPRVQLSAVVLQGSDAHTLRRGPGHLEKSALPGSSGNVVIAGHRDSFFWPLRNIQRGDDIFLDTPEARFQYRVTSVRVVNARDVSVLASTTGPVLTLITCYPFWEIGDAPDRFVVRATAVGRGPAEVMRSHDGMPTGGGTNAVTIEASASAMPDPEGTLVTDDEVLVRLTVERYRLTYNGQLIRRNAMRPGGGLRFATCDVTATGDQATAVCESVRPPADGPAGRTFLLKRTAGAWEIKTVIVNEERVP